MVYPYSYGHGPPPQQPPPLRDVGTAYVLLLFFGLWGAHRFYLGHTGIGLLYFFTFAFLGVGWIVDLIILGNEVRSFNARVHQQHAAIAAWYQQQAQWQAQQAQAQAHAQMQAFAQMAHHLSQGGALPAPPAPQPARDEDDDEPRAWVRR